jgi:predicted proteasome-type protease
MGSRQIIGLVFAEDMKTNTKITWNHTKECLETFNHCGDLMLIYTFISEWII